MAEDTKPLTTETVIWQNRLVKMLDETTWAMSAVGNHDDWDFAPEKHSEDMAVAGNMSYFRGAETANPSPLKRIFVLDENRLLFEAVDDSFWVLMGNPCKDGLIKRYAPE